jgi:hypothetical protein
MARSRPTAPTRITTNWSKNNNLYI